MIGPTIRGEFPSPRGSPTHPTGVGKKRIRRWTRRWLRPRRSVRSTGRSRKSVSSASPKSGWPACGPAPVRRSDWPSFPAAPPQRLRPASAADLDSCSTTSRNHESGARPGVEWGTRYSGSRELGQEVQRVEDLEIRQWSVVSGRRQRTRDQGLRTNGRWRNGGIGSGLICGDLPRRATVHRSGRRRFVRPGRRNVDSNPRRFAVACCQTVSPKGVPTWMMASGTGLAPGGGAKMMETRVRTLACAASR